MYLSTHKAVFLIMLFLVDVSTNANQLIFTLNL